MIIKRVQFTAEVMVEFTIKRNWIPLGPQPHHDLLTVCKFGFFKLVKDICRLEEENQREKKNEMLNKFQYSSKNK